MAEEGMEHNSETFSNWEGLLKLYQARYTSKPKFLEIGRQKQVQRVTQKKTWGWKHSKKYYTLHIMV